MLFSLSSGSISPVKKLIFSLKVSQIKQLLVKMSLENREIDLESRPLRSNG